MLLVGGRCGVGGGGGEDGDGDDDDDDVDRQIAELKMPLSTVATQSLKYLLSAKLLFPF